ncbi:MAG TPA: UvrD-helicase domain-containing protein [Gemmatimonadales bacterium]|nr:UvrD-helicase domain-containing protein [Gemmatimonadales bacterium]
MTAAPASDFSPSPRQRAAIEAPLGPVLVVAGPGAGKTFCLIERIRYLIAAKAFDPARICAVTFTNKAAQEIAERLGRALGSPAEGVTGGTLHALCAEILRTHGEWIGARRGFGIADDEYQKEVLKRLGIWEKRQAWLLNRFGLHRVRGVELTPEDLDIYHRYRAHLKHRNLLDFDDLVIKTAELFASYPEIAEEVAARWDYILVDEFQDLNPPQYAVVRRLAERHRNLFAVGDDEQSVFSWTGADPKVLRDFMNDFRVTDIVMLDENRRTDRRIFEAARLLLQQNPSLFADKFLRAERESGHPVRVLGFDDDHAEAGWLLRDLVADQAEFGLPWGEYGVLYRRHEIGNALEAELISAGIPCRLASGRALQDDPVVKYLIAGLRVIAEPGDPVREEAFVRVVLPPMLWNSLVSDAGRKKVGPLEWMRTVAKRLGRTDEEGKKYRRADSALQNLAALGRKHTTLLGLVEELLSHRIGENETVLEKIQDELSDPASDPGIVALAARLKGALHGRRRVWIPRMGGLEIALGGLLLRAGVTTVVYEPEPQARQDPTTGGSGDDDVHISPKDGGRSGLALGLFKALQIVHTGALTDVFRDFVTADVETTDRDSATCDIIELGAVRVRDGQIVDRYEQRVRPRVPISEGARKTHGITDEELKDAPRLHEVWGAFRAFCGDDIIVAHNGAGFDFPVLRRLGAELPGGAEFVGYDSLLLARQLHPGSRKLVDLAHAFGIVPARSHSAYDDSRVLALVFSRLQTEKLARARKTALVHLLDYLGLALVLSDPKTFPEEVRPLWRIARGFARGRYSDCLEHYRLERAAPDAFDAPSLEEVIRRLGGQRRLEQSRKDKTAEARYPGAMARLRRLLEASTGTSLAEELREFLNRVALSRSDAAEKDLDFAHRVNLLTLHSTKGLEFSRVYIIGAEDAQLPGMPRDGREPPEGELEEARRLLYVGMTRAKDRLVLTRVERRRDLPTGGYRFLTEMGFKPAAP